MAWLIPKGAMGALIANFPWDGTEFGPLEAWPPHLRLITNLMLESAGPMAIVWGPKFRFLYNDSYRDLLQDKHPASLGGAAENVFPEIWPALSPLFRQALRGEPVVIEDIELSVLRNGVLKDSYFSGSYTPIRAADGSVDGFLASVVETTSRIERERQRSKEFDTMLSSIPDFAYCLDRDGRFVYVNRSLLNLWGLTLKEAVGKNFYDLKYPEDLAERLQRQIQTVIATRQRLRDQTPYVSPSGVIGDYIFSPVFAADGSVAVVAGTTRDISDSQKHAGELEELVKVRTARLQETITDLESYSYSISHDLRGPLRVMQSFAEALREDCGEEMSVTAKDYIRRIVAASERMDRIIQDVLVHSRLSRSEMPLEPLALEEFIPSLLDSYPAFHDSVAEIVIEQPLPVVLANHAALSQCVANLVGNATKFVAPGVRPKVVISGRVARGRAYVSVRDNGIGIPEKDRSVIFNAFHRLHATYDGTGIGLSIVRKAVERMGGKVLVEDAPGGGSVFTFDLQHVQR